MFANLLAWPAWLLAESDVGDFWFPPQWSETAKSVDFAFYVVHWITIVLFVPLIAVTMWFVVRYRRRPGVGPQPSPSHNQTLELIWSIIPVFIVAGIFYVGVDGFLDMRTMPNDALEIKVTARQWEWTFKYPNGAESNHLHVPVNTRVMLVMQSNDVLHSLFIPNLRVKQDVVPGRYTRLWFEANTVGESILHCTEYCGKQHSGMSRKFQVHESGDYNRWVTDAADIWKSNANDPVKVGKELYLLKGCAGCHSIAKGDDQGKKGPTWFGQFGTPRQFSNGHPEQIMDEAYVEESIRAPMLKIRAPYAGGMSPYPPDQIDKRDLGAIVEFIKSLK